MGLCLHFHTTSQNRIVESSNLKMFFKVDSLESKKLYILYNNYVTIIILQRLFFFFFFYLVVKGEDRILTPMFQQTCYKSGCEVECGFERERPLTHRKLPH